MTFRKFQVRDFKGLYSVVFHDDLPNGKTITYEHKEHIDLPYEKAVQIAREFEDLYQKNEMKVNVKDSATWEYIYED